MISYLYKINIRGGRYDEKDNDDNYGIAISSLWQG